MAQSDGVLDQLRLPDDTLATSAGPTDPFESRSERRVRDQALCARPDSNSIPFKKPKDRK